VQWFWGVFAVFLCNAEFVFFPLLIYLRGKAFATYFNQKKNKKTKKNKKKTTKKNSEKVSYRAQERTHPSEE
jgi:hypothetical protein